MQRLHCKFAARSKYLSSQEMAAVFQLLDKDKSGILAAGEVSEMFTTICGRPVKVHGGLTRYNLSQFINVVEDTNTRYPQFKVVENLAKYLRANVSAVETDPLCLENCTKLMQVMDADRTGVLDLGELWNLFRFLRIPTYQLIEAFNSYGDITSATEFRTLLKEINQKYPQYDIDDKIVAFVGDAAGGKPNLSGAAEVPVPPAEPVAKKKAFLVGINYIGQQSELGGCINDVRNQMRALTQRYGFTEDDILLLTEDQGRPDKLPTKANIVQGFKWLFQDASPGDILFFQYSGHGSQMPDRTGTEPDGKNECICPLDCNKGWPEYIILDNEIYRTFYEGLPQGVKCICVFDCCHSGSVADLQCTREFRLDEDADIKPRYLEPPEDVAEELRTLVPVASRAVALPSDQDPNKMLWTYSGCQDNQTSADATINGQRQGALTWGFLKALEDSNWKVSYDGLLNAARKNLHGRYQQVPALSTTCEGNFNHWYLEAK